ncbi:MAG: exo-alpha-sialidase [Planctomycetota bacterium]|nr:exo-alpha-sialidase [Planctomycetota bacterium]
MTHSPTSLRWSLILLIAGLIAAGLHSRGTIEPRFSIANPIDAHEKEIVQPLFSPIELPRPEISAHASSMAFLPDGTLLVSWFGGSREGADDVAIWMARVKDGRTQDSWIALTCKQLEGLTHRVIRTLGNPVVWIDTKGDVRLHVVSVSYGGWAGSSINQLRSEDGGKSWSEAQRLILSPFFNLSTLVRNQVVAMEDGTIGLPAYHEFLHKWGIWVRFTTEGRVLQCERMPSDIGQLLQPAVIATSATDALAVLRNTNSSQPVIGRSATKDGGQSWSLMAPLEIPNPNSSACMIRLRDGSVLIAANPLANGRNILQLFRSRDGGTSWEASRIIERGEKGSEFSYPSFAQSAEGMIYLSYTWQRKGIRLCAFNAAWLDAGGNDNAAMESAP